MLIFLGGVHGVGKTAMCEDFAGKLGLIAVSASAVIRGERQQPSSDSRTVVKDVDGNQSLLIRGVRRLLSDAPGCYLLDGHFALRTLAGNIEKVDANVFNEMGVKGLICLVDEPVAIAHRLTVRDGLVPDAVAISELQSYELHSAEAVSRALGVELKVVQAFDGHAFEGAVRSFLD